MADPGTRSLLAMGRPGQGVIDVQSHDGPSDRGVSVPRATLTGAFSSTLPEAVPALASRSAGERNVLRFRRRGHSCDDRQMGTGRRARTDLIRVLIADDQQLVRAGLRLIIEGETDMCVVGQADDGLEAVDLARKRAPDVVLLDVRMPGMDGLAAARRIIDQTDSRVLLLTTLDADHYVFEGLRAGASGFLLKDVPPEQLCWALRNIAAGNAVIDPTVTRRLLLRFAAAARATGETPEELTELTVRELEVLRLIARGRSNAEIASELVVEESTVKSHVGRILIKLGLRDRVQAVVLAYESGLVTPDLLAQ